MKPSRDKTDPVDELANQLCPAAKQLAALQERANALGMFTNERELLACPRCGLEDDVNTSGQLLTCREPNLGQDTGLRFKEITGGHFICPSCGQIVPEPPGANLNCHLDATDS
ncbi:MAG: hypothetical protein WCO56_22105 [Verrucomicrobiota bacterium]